ncbi:MAG TPA: pyridoxal-dependent decarboxylase [Pseudonocardiaceae bacterium]|nr:pyridoxal-dependent decarboxylase [Pseudonocardiaceae bacterium]
MERLLAGGRNGPETLAELIPIALAATITGQAHRAHPAPAGGPSASMAAVAALGPLLPTTGVGAEAALRDLTTAFVAGAVDPAEPWCAAHLHGPSLAVAAVADLVISAVNPSLDSWDQAPFASALERALTAELAALCFPDAPAPDALITSGGTESNLLGLLLAREHAGLPVTPVCGANAHHSVARAAWLLGLPQPIVVDCADERLRPDALRAVLAEITGPAVVVATAGTTDAGVIDPLPAIADIAREYRARLHVDAAYGGTLLFSSSRAPLLAGLDRADTVTVDLHKLGWQPIPAGVLISADAADLAPLGITADYLNAADDVEAGMPDLLGRSLRTSRRADAFGIAVSLRALGRAGLAALIDRCCTNAADLAAAIDAHPALRLWRTPTLTTVLLRPAIADQLDPALGDDLVAGLRRRLLDTGQAVLGRARIANPDGTDSRWLKLTLLNPTATVADYLPLLDLIADTADALRAGQGRS